MPLWDIWHFSLGLAGLSIGTMLLLILRRMVTTRFERTTARLRQAAAAALFDYMEGHGDPATVRLAAGERADVIADLLFEMRDLVRGERAERLVRLALDIGEYPRAQRGLRSRNPSTRADAVRRLTMFGPAAVGDLETALNDRNVGVRTVAAVELSSMDRAPPLAVLAEKMGVGLDCHSEDLHRIFRRAVAADLSTALRLLEDDWTDDALRLLLLDGLGHAGAFPAVPVIRTLMISGSADMRAEALRTLALLAHPAGADIALEALQDSDWRVRAQAATCVQRIGVREAVGPLADLLKDPQWWVRLRAAQALASLGVDGRTALELSARRTDRAGEVARLVLAENLAAA